MRRKLIQHGMSSLTVSLPRRWIKEKNLKKGDEVEVEDKDGMIVIDTQKHFEHKKMDVNIVNAHPMIRKIIGATYKSGYDEVHIRFGSYEELKAVQELIREQFSGFEIINQSKDSIVVKNILESNFLEFGNVLRRFFLVVNQIAIDTAEAMQKSDFNWMKRITLMKVESDKFADFCRRAINLKGEIEYKRNAPLYTIIEQLEKVVDRYRDLCEYISKERLKPGEKINTFMRELAEFQDMFYRIFYTFKIESVVNFGRVKEVMQKRLDALGKNASKKEIKVITLADRILNLTFDLNGPLMAVYI